jgi:hypothetical protein
MDSIHVLEWFLHIIFIISLPANFLRISIYLTANDDGMSQSMTRGQSMILSDFRNTNNVLDWKSI